MENKNIYIIGGLFAVAVIFLLMKKSGSASPTVVSTGSGTSGTDATTANLQSQAINADVFKTLASGVFGSNQANAQNAISREISLAQIGAARDVGLAGNQISLAQISAARDVGLAQAQATATGNAAAEARYAAQQNLQNSVLRAQNTSSLLQGLMSSLNKLLPSLGAQPKPTSAPSSGSPASSGPGAAKPPTLVKRPAIPLPPSLSNALSSFFNFGGSNEPAIPFDGYFDYGDYAGFQNDVQPGFDSSLGEPPAMQESVWSTISYPDAPSGNAWGSDFVDGYWGNDFNSGSYDAVDYSNYEGGW